MSIPVGESIGLEMHSDTDQFLRLDAGTGKAQMGPDKDNLIFEHDVSDGWCILVLPAPGTMSPTPATNPCSST
ncbi:cupin domain-containing protein [Arthrobacter sp. RHLT1-20]